MRDKDGYAPAPANLTSSIAYNGEKVKTPPQSFKEFADPKLERFTPVSRNVKVPAEIAKEVLTVDQMQKMNRASAL